MRESIFLCTEKLTSHFRSDILVIYQLVVFTRVHIYYKSQFQIPWIQFVTQ